MDALANFMKAIDNYDLYHESDLIRYGTVVCISYDLSDFDTAIEAYSNFSEEVARLELYGTEDLVRPITKIYRLVEEVDS
jgi:hypothetical protein